MTLVEMAVGVDDAESRAARPRARRACDYQRFFSESGDADMNARHAPTTIFFRWALKELARFLGCAPGVDAVLAARAALGADALTDRMFRDANLGMLLVAMSISASPATRRRRGPSPTRDPRPRARADAR